jgi:hypothetical protein
LYVVQYEAGAGNADVILSQGRLMRSGVYGHEIGDPSPNKGKQGVPCCPDPDHPLLMSSSLEILSQLDLFLREKKERKGKEGVGRIWLYGMVDAVPFLAKGV